MCCIIENYQTKCANGRAHRSPTAQPLAWHAAWHSMRTVGGPPPPQWRGVLTHRAAAAVARCADAPLSMYRRQVWHQGARGASAVHGRRVVHPVRRDAPRAQEGPRAAAVCAHAGAVGGGGPGQGRVAGVHERQGVAHPQHGAQHSRQDEGAPRPADRKRSPARSPSPWPLALTLPARPHRARSPCLLAAVRRPSVAKCRRCRNDAGGMAAARE
jgi:hypothetical protein